MKKKRSLILIMVLSIVFATVNVGAVSDVYAQEPMELEELNIQEDPLGLEDGEMHCDEQKVIEEEDDYVFRVERYLASGVNSVAYKAGLIHGVDVSKYQQTIDWKKVKASGIDFAMIRVGYRGYETGAICADPYFEKNIQNALAAGLKVGIYFFSQAITAQEAYEEASYTIQMIKKYKITYPVAFDWETSAGYRTYNANIVGAKMTTIASKFCDTIAAAGYIPIVYANTSDFKGRFDYNTLSAKYYIWYARYLPEYGGTVWYKQGNRLANYDNNFKFNIWQYMSDGTVPGINGNCDVNISLLDFGTLAEPVKTEVKLTSSRTGVTVDVSKLQISGFGIGTTYQEIVNAFPNFSVVINGKAVGSGSTAVVKNGDKLTFGPKASNTYLKNTTYSLLLHGDVTGDGIQNALDMENIQKYLLSMEKLEGISYQAADVTGDGKVTVLDMEKIQQKLLGLID